MVDVPASDPELPRSPEEGWVHGIDYLRAIMSVFVVTWHMKGGGRSSLFNADEYSTHSFNASDFVNFHVLLLAVPVFVLVSNWLFACRGGSRALRRSICRIFILLVFWVSVRMIWRAENAQPVIGVVHWGSFLTTVLTGCHTTYWFFVALLVAMVLTHLAAKLCNWALLLGCAVAVCCTATLPVIGKLSGAGVLGAYWNPLNFVAYPFCAIILLRQARWIGEHRTRVVALLASVSVVFAVFEWHVNKSAIFSATEGCAFPCYTRASLLCSSAALVVMATSTRIRPTPHISFMSRHALALYCLHPFLIHPAKACVSILGAGRFISTYAAIVLVILSSYVVSMVLPLFLKERVLR